MQKESIEFYKWDKHNAIIIKHNCKRPHSTTNPNNVQGFGATQQAVPAADAKKDAAAPAAPAAEQSKEAAPAAETPAAPAK